MSIVVLDGILRAHTRIILSPVSFGGYNDVLEGRNISKEAQKCVDLNFPSVIAYPFAMVLNYAQQKDRKDRGVVDFDRRPYIDG